MEIGLVSCSKKKRDRPCKPKLLYDKSSLFNKKKSFCRLFHHGWYILSAKHTLLDPEGSVISPYNESLKGKSKEDKKMWSLEIFNSLKELDLLKHKIVIHAGKDYYENLLPLLERSDVEYEIPTKGLRFGEKMAWYKKRIESINISGENFCYKHETGKITT